jgi:hypothetical protein
MLSQNKLVLSQLNKTTIHTKGGGPRKNVVQTAATAHGANQTPLLAPSPLRVVCTSSPDMIQGTICLSRERQRERERKQEGKNAAIYVSYLFFFSQINI